MLSERKLEVRPFFHPISMRAMNTPVEMLLYTDPESFRAVRHFAGEWLRSIEDRFSRFIPKSELSQLNRLEGQRCLVSDAMLEVLLLAERYRELTEGTFDPLLLEAMEKEGYDATFELVSRRSGHRLGEGTVMPDNEGSLAVDPMMKSVQLPEGKRLDLGGIVKSWAVSRLANYFRRIRGISQGLVNAGGDLTVWGRSEEGLDPWMIGIEDPWQPDNDIGTLRIGEGSTATSSTLGRRWRTDRGERHHLLDPRTGHSADSGVVQCTVAGPDVRECEVWAKTICILGAEAGPAMMLRKASGYEAVMFTDDRKLIYCGAKSSLLNKWSLPRADAYLFQT